MISKSIDKIIPSYYLAYGTYVNRDKMLPLVVDGLLPVHRRVLLSAHIIAKQKFVKTANAMGLVAGQWHPHEVGVGPFTWAVQNGFVDGDGQWGSNVGKTLIGAAAPRYTKLKANKDIEEMAFKYIEYVKWEVGELDHKEPIFLPTMIPFCLMAKNELLSIGFGFKTQIPCFQVKDLVNRLMFLLGKKKKSTPIPNIPGCDVLSDKKDVEEIISTGKGSIKIRGKFLIDEKNYIVRIFGWSPRTTYETLEKRIDNYKGWKLITNGDIGSNDDSEGTTNIRFEILKRHGRNNIWSKLKEAVEKCLEASLSYEIIVVDPKDRVLTVSVDEMLKNTYLFFEFTFQRFLKHSISKLEEEIKDFIIIKKLGPHISKVTSTYSDQKQIYSTLSALIKEGVEDIERICKKYRINNLMTADTDTSELEKNKGVFQKQLDNLKEETISQYENLSNRE